MSRIEIIAAGAGSGKTTRLTSILEEAVVQGDVRPDSIIATTFTNKAAAELTERTRGALIAAGRVDDAQRLAASRIGTVNAICGRLVGEFAFELGLSPRLRVLDEDAAKQELSKAISTTIEGAEAAELEDLARRVASLRDDQTRKRLWVDRVREIVDLARSNGIADPGPLREHGRRSADTIGELLPASAPSGEALDRALKDALARFVDSVDPGCDSTKTTAKAVDEARKQLADLRAGRALAWDDWARLAALQPGKKSDGLAEPVRAVAADHQRHPGLRWDLTRTIELVFELAARALEAYRDHKRDAGVLDFTDQEVLALAALRLPEARERLVGEVDLLLVDEFQDTSPIQLAIFLALAGFAKRTIWVGDQKQAIYGFRGTDPALMDAAIEAILMGGEPETLALSWRSRPELVRLTSDLFVPAFEAQGLPPARVRLEPGLTTEPTGLGAIAERWILEATNQLGDAGALAAAVREALSDPTVRVRDRDAGTTRAVQAGDIAVLCKTHDSCARVADALEALGIRVVRPRAGLTATVEVRTALAALRLRIDTADSLAAAELARLLEFPSDGSGWLEALLEKPGIEAFADLAVIARLRAAATDDAGEGAVAALDAAIRLADLRERCLMWGDAEERLSNLDRLRAHAVTYVERAAVEGAGATAAGLLVYLDELASEGTDERAVLSTGVDAVNVSTWHAAKGLEWPIVVLFDLGEPRLDSALGVRVTSDRERLDLADPLAGRWVRYWPNPYNGRRGNTPFHARLADHRFEREAQERSRREALRLLYVVWTRARDRVVLAARDGKLVDGILTLLATPEGRGLMTEVGEVTTWAGRVVDVCVRQAQPAAAARPASPDASEGYDLPAEVRSYPPAFETPSAAVGEGVVGEVVELGARVPLSGSPDMEAIGEAVHAFLSADAWESDAAERVAMARVLLERWGVASAVSPEDLVLASDRLRAWIEDRWAGANLRREWPILHRQQTSTIVRGRADLVIELDEGFTIIDHKTFPGRSDAALERAKGFAGQLAAYAAAVGAATGKRCLGLYVHLPVLGRIVRVAQSGASG